MQIGVISDTHGLLRQEALNFLAGSDLIVHAGDIGPRDILDRLAEIAPVTAVRGNVDRDPWCSGLGTDEVIEVEGRSIYVIHDLGTMQFAPHTAGFEVVISGHSHKPGVTERDAVLFLNPGSAGPRRFSLPICLATLRIDKSGPVAELHEISL